MRPLPPCARYRIHHQWFVGGTGTTARAGVRSSTRWVHASRLASLTELAIGLVSETRAPGNGRGIWPGSHLSEDILLRASNATEGLAAAAAAGRRFWSHSGIPEAYFRTPWKPTSANNR